MNDKTNIKKSTLEISCETRAHYERTVATEMPLALCYNGVAYVVMMVTPDDIENFIVGFSLTEGIIHKFSDIDEIMVKHNEEGIVANIWIDKTLHKKLLGRQRNLVGQTGCGLCGVEALEDAIRSYTPVGTPPAYTSTHIHNALKELDAMQPLHQKTGAIHGAAYMSKAGKILHVCEDVGRHNAFDKLIGTLYSAGNKMNEGAVILTSRCSFELVQKALAVKLPMLITISAPTSLACDLAEKHNLTLIALARHDSIQVMNDPHNLFNP